MLVTLIRKSTYNMKPILKLRSEGIYLLEGRAVAKNLFFESKYDIEQAHRFAKRYFNGMIDVLEYNFTPHGWSLIIQNYLMPIQLQLTVISNQLISHHIIPTLL